MNLDIKKNIKVLLMVFVPLMVFNIFVPINFVMAAGVDFGVTVDNHEGSYPPPDIISAANITKNTLDLTVLVGGEFSDTLLNYEITITNTFTGGVSIGSYTQTTDASGAVVLAIDNLDSGVEYKFEAQYAPIGNGYSGKSMPYNAVTVIDPPILDSIDNVEEESVDLDVIVDLEFIGVTMDFTVNVYKNGGYSHQVHLTRHITEQYITLPIDDLDAGEDYSFKVKYARENTLHFSDYSNEKSITMDEEELEAPEIILIDNITTSSMDLVVNIDGRAGENLDFKIKMVNKTTGQITNIEVNINVGSDDNVVFHISNLNYDTEYEFKVKYSPENTDGYSDYSDPKSGRTKNIESQENTIICYNELTLVVSSLEQLQEYLNDGATIGECGVEPGEESISICYEGGEMVIVQSELQTYIDNGATQGGCIPIDNSEDEVEVCYEGETIWTSLTSQIFKKATPGECKKGPVAEEGREDVEQEEKIFQGVAVIGAVAGATMAVASSGIPLLAVMPGALGGAVLPQLLRLLGLFGRTRRVKKWGMVFEESTHLPIVNAKIVLIDEEDAKVAVTHSDKDGRFGFTVEPGDYILKIENENYKIVMDLKDDELFENVYKGDKIVLEEDDKIPTVNIAVQLTNINMEEYAQEKVEQYMSLWSNIKKGLFLLIYTIGFLSTAAITYFYPSIFNFGLLGVYVGIFIFQVFFKKRDYGFVRMANGRPVSFAIVSLYDKILSKEHGFAITDSIGRYNLQTENGTYDLKVKNQSASGVVVDERGEVFIKKGVLNKDIIV
jgi:hypothetical protein